MKMTKGSIRYKIMFVIAASVMIVILMGAVLTYFAGSAVLKNVSGREYSQIANILSVYTTDALNGEIEDAVTYTTRILWKGAIKESNSRYEGMDAGSIKLRLLEMDKRWIAAKPGDPILKEYLESRISQGMADILRARTRISEIFITDKYGGLVAASNRTSDFYQADEEWWQKAYNGGKGDVYLSDIELDESGKSWVVSIAVPIKDSISKEVIGVCKDNVGIEKLFGDLANFRLGNTGHAILIDDKGTVIFHHGISKMTEKVFTEEALRKMLNRKKSYLVMKNYKLHEKEAFVAFNKVKSPHSANMGISWIMLIVQDASEVFAPIDNFIIQIVIIVVLMMTLIIPVGYFFGKLIADPIHELHLATERVMAGDWDYKIDVRTGDEIEQFAATFRDMIADIKNKQKELQSFSDGLEAKVEERTKELKVAQEATLNILEDLQASKEALESTNKELLKLDQLKSDFISTVSHELRTPLSIIKEGISLVIDKIPGDLNEKQAKILDIAKSNIDRLARIIDNLLDISKMDAGKAELKRRLMDISDIVRQTAASFEGIIKGRHLELRVDVDQMTGSIYADPDKITQVLTNLIGNAVKFTPSGHIDISCKSNLDAVVCSIADTGVGIAKENLPKVFGKFQQFDRTPGAGDKGTGLGLSIVKNIIDMHNGAIWVESEAGKGAKFTFSLHKYTPQSLFRECVARSIERAANDGAEMSIIAVNLDPIAGNDADMSGKKPFDIMGDSARLIKSTLRREGDDVVNAGNELIVILAGCDKESSVRIQYRLEEIVKKYLVEKGLDNAIKVKFGCATYPDDAKGNIDLIEKAHAASNISAKA